MLSHFLDNRFSESGAVDSREHQALLAPKEYSLRSFLLEAVAILEPYCGWKD
jgi:hypothetical protein